MKKKMKAALLTTAICGTLFLSGCADLAMSLKGFEESFKGLEMVIQTYDEESQIIDRVIGRSVAIERDTTFDTTSTNSEGATTSNQDSSVLQINVGDNEMHHVGSSMIVAETGLPNVLEEVAKTVDLQNTDPSVPFINFIVNDFKNSFTGKEKIILIRSQNGTPLATYVGDSVSIYSTEVPKSTGLLVDGKYLFIYRCDYTIYDAALLGGI